MAHPESVKFSVQIRQELSNTKYACSSLKALSGGNANWIFKGLLTRPLEDGTEEVAIKHGEGYLASSSGFELPTARCRIEEECLKAVEKMSLPEGSSHVVRTPKLYDFSADSNTQIQEYLPHGIDFKSYALKHFAAAPDASRRPLCLEIGQSLGSWLRQFHIWVSQAEQAGLHDIIKSNKAMQDLKHMVNYTRLLATVDSFPSILQDAREVFVEVEKLAASELERDDLQVIHGDFWTGNVLLSNEPLKQGAKKTIFIIDWEVCVLGVRPLDLGQMIAELYELSLYKNMDEGKWVVEGFASGYGGIDDDFAFRTAIHVGTHLVVWGSSVPDWGSPEQVERVVATGKELIVRAWHKDRGWYEAGDLACLFRRP